MKTLEKGVVLQRQAIREGIISLWLHAPEICRQSRPGQFVHIRITPSFQPLLRRPISIGRVLGEELELIWRVVGEGTRLLAKAQPGDVVDLLGPLGRPFTLDDSIETSILVGGGLGTPPVVYLYEYLKSMGHDSILLVGARSRGDLPLADNDPILSDATVITELDDPRFRRGLVTEPLVETLVQLETKGRLSNSAVYACGPWGLVGALQRTLENRAVKCAEVSLEQQMGCGVGVCQGCAVIARGGPTPYQLVCSDGPVFNLYDVEVPGAV